MTLTAQVLNPGDLHAWGIADTTSGGITKGIQYIQDIYDAYLK